MYFKKQDTPVMILCGSLGSGITSIGREVATLSGNSFEYCPPVTTRELSKFESMKDYYSVTKKSFSEMISGNSLIEYAKTVEGELRGTTKTEFLSKMNKGIIPILDINYENAPVVAKYFEDSGQPYRLYLIKSPYALIIRNLKTKRGVEGSILSDIAMAEVKKVAKCTKQFKRLFSYKVWNDCKSCIGTIAENIHRIHMAS